jgi:hypothetical protein
MKSRSSPSQSFDNGISDTPIIGTMDGLPDGGERFDGSSDETIDGLSGVGSFDETIDGVSNVCSLDGTVGISKCNGPFDTL